MVGQLVLSERRRLSAGVREITLDGGGGLTLSALRSAPPDGRVRATIVALHGAGMGAAYFDGQAHPEASLLTLAAELGHAVVAIDRPGYGRSADRLPLGQPVADQAAALSAALWDLGLRYEVGAGVFLLAHSFGGKVALQIAAQQSAPELLGLDISGCGEEYAVDRDQLIGAGGRTKGSWGPLRLYPPGTFRASGATVAATPAAELHEVARWPETFPAVAGLVRVPVRLTFAEFEAFWRHDEHGLARLRSRFHASPQVVVDRQPAAGHNISLGWTARSYHLRALAFVEECVQRRRVSGARPSEHRA